MSIEGDLQAMLFVRHKMQYVESTAILESIVECLKEPDFAFRYARANLDGGANVEEQMRGLMSSYWQVVSFWGGII